MIQEIEICKTLECLPEKFIVDFANSIDVAKDHSSVQRQANGIFTRLFDGLRGKSRIRQSNINDSLTDSVESSLKWLTELTESHARSNYAIAQVNDRVNELKLDAAKIANHSVETRQQLENLENRLERRCKAIEDEVIRIDFTQRVQIHMDQVFDKWSAGRFLNLPLAGRCYAVAEELCWGAYGDFCRTRPDMASQFKENAVNRAITQLSKDAGIPNATERLDVKQWLDYAGETNADNELCQALSYMGDGYCSESAPFAFTASQSPVDLPIYLPLLCSAERLFKSTMEEVFGGRHYV